MATLRDFTVPNEVDTGAVGQIDDIAAALRAGLDSTLLTGTAGTSGNILQWNADGDAIDSGTATSALVLTTSSIDALSDVDTTTTAPTDGDVLTWNNTNSEWEPQSFSDTRTDVSDNGVLVVSGVSDINFNTRLNVTDDTDGTVTIDIPITGADANVVTGTAGTSGNLIEWNVDGDAVDSALATSDVVTPTSTDTFTNKTFDANATGNTLSNVEVADFASSALSGLDTTVVTGTAGTSGNLVEWNTDGDAVDSGVATSNLTTNSTFDWTIVSTATTASVNDRILADTSGAAFTITLPAAPATGNQIKIADIAANWSTNNLTVDGNGNTVEGSATFTADADKGSFYTIYNGTEWIVRFGTGI